MAHTPAPRKSIRIDGHAHVFLESLPMLENRRYTPTYNALPQDYFKKLKANGLNGCLLVQPSFLGTDNDYLLKVLDQAKLTEPDLLVRGVAVLHPTTSMQEMFGLKKSGITGIRLNCLARDLPDFESKLWISFLQQVEELGWHVEVQVEGHRLPWVIDHLIKTVSRIVIDHFGLPDTSNLSQCKGFNRLKTNTSTTVCVKLSAPYRVYPELAVAQAAKACEILASQLIDTIGPQRLIWGSDWPWTQHEKGQHYEDCLQWGNHWYQDQEIRPGNAPEWLMNPDCAG